MFLIYIKDLPRGLQADINPFVPNAPFLYPLKTSENLKVGYIGNKFAKSFADDTPLFSVVNDIDESVTKPTNDQ